MDLVTRLNDFLEYHDPYKYGDCEMSLEKVEQLLRESPETIINELLNIIEEMEEE